MLAALFACHRFSQLMLGNPTPFAVMYTLGNVSQHAPHQPIVFVPLLLGRSHTRQFLKVCSFSSLSDRGNRGLLLSYWACHSGRWNNTPLNDSLYRGCHAQH